MKFIEKVEFLFRRGFDYISSELFKAEKSDFE